MKASALSRLAKLSILAAVAFVFLYFCNRYSTPMVGTTGIDYDMFLMGGEFFRNNALYTGFFDNKGPYLFAINALGLAIGGGKWGLFLLEVLNLTVALEMIRRLCHSLGARRRATAVALVTVLLLLGGIVRYGDSVEMWSLPWAMWPLFLFVKRRERSDEDSRVAIVAGLSIGVIALMRLNDASIPLAVLAADICGATYRSTRLRRSLIALGGVLVAMLPAVLWFWHTGGLREMLDATFVYNFRYWVYQSPASHRGVAQNVLLLSSCLFLPLVGWRATREKGLHWLFLFVGVLTFLSIVKSRTLAHYFIMCLPLVAMTVAMLPCLSRKWMRIACWLALTLPYLILYGGDYRLLANRAVGRFTDSLVADSLMNYDARVVSSVLRAIPPEELDSVYQLDLPMKYWGLLYHAGHLPMGGYACQQTMVADIAGDARRADIVQKFSRANPLWVVSAVELEKSLFKDYSPGYMAVDTVAIPGWGEVRVYRRKVSRH